MEQAMISHLGDGDWEQISLEEAKGLVAEKKAYRCETCDDPGPGGEPYDDGLPSFHYLDEDEAA